jgi:dimethylglycine dehydrogenase
LRNITTSRGTFVVAGPKARDVLARLTDTPLDNAHFPWLTGQVIDVGLATDVLRAARQLHRRARVGTALPDRVRKRLLRSAVRRRRRIRHRHGRHARDGIAAHRKSYRMWGSDLTRDYTPFEAGLDRFVRMDKGNFVGKAALARQLDEGVPNRFVDARSALASPTPIRSGTSRYSMAETLVGRATAGYYGHVLGKSLALAYIDPKYSAVGAAESRSRSSVRGSARACCRVAARSRQRAVTGVARCARHRDARRASRATRHLYQPD